MRNDNNEVKLKEELITIMLEELEKLVGGLDPPP